MFQTFCIPVQKSINSSHENRRSSWAWVFIVVEDEVGNQFESAA